MIHIRTYGAHNEGRSGKPNVKRHEISGFKVLQGRDAETNDLIVTEMSADDDYWLHAKGVPGSHVLIKTEGRVPDHQTIEAAARIAAANSRASGPDVEVVYCKRKFVSKRPGMKPGEVAVEEANSNKINIRI